MEDISLGAVEAKPVVVNELVVDGGVEKMKTTTTSVVSVPKEVLVQTVQNLTALRANLALQVAALDVKIKEAEEKLAQFK
jgi:hypothetical protein